MVNNLIRINNDKKIIHKNENYDSLVYKTVQSDNFFHSLLIFNDSMFLSWHIFRLLKLVNFNSKGELVSEKIIHDANGNNKDKLINFYCVDNEFLVFLIKKNDTNIDQYHLLIKSDLNGDVIKSKQLDQKSSDTNISVIENKIFAFGSYDNNKRLEMLDINLDTESVFSTTDNTFGFYKYVVGDLNSKIYVNMELHENKNGFLEITNLNNNGSIEILSGLTNLISNNDLFGYDDFNQIKLYSYGSGVNQVFYGIYYDENNKDDFFLINKFDANLSKIWVNDNKIRVSDADDIYSDDYIFYDLMINDNYIYFSLKIELDRGFIVENTWENVYKYDDSQDYGFFQIKSSDGSVENALMSHIHRDISQVSLLRENDNNYILTGSYKNNDLSNTSIQKFNFFTLDGSTKKTYKYEDNKVIKAQNKSIKISNYLSNILSNKVSEKLTKEERNSFKNFIFLHENKFKKISEEITNSQTIKNLGLLTNKSMDILTNKVKIVLMDSYNSENKKYKLTNRDRNLLNNNDEILLLTHENREIILSDKGKNYKFKINGKYIVYDNKNYSVNDIITLDNRKIIVRGIGSFRFAQVNSEKYIPVKYSGAYRTPYYYKRFEK